MEKKKKVTVWIKCRQVMEFDQQVELTKEEYDILNDVEDTDINRYDNPKAYSILEGHINFNEILDSEDEFTDFEMYNPKAPSTTKL